MPMQLLYTLLRFFIAHEIGLDVSVVYFLVLFLVNFFLIFFQLFHVVRIHFITPDTTLKFEYFFVVFFVHPSNNYSWYCLDMIYNIFVSRRRYIVKVYVYVRVCFLDKCRTVFVQMFPQQIITYKINLSYLILEY